MEQFDVNFDDLANKLFCTFTVEQGLDGTLDEISSKYQILFNKIFVLYIESTNEYVCTYNVDSFNITDYILPNTILLHRKKESNTLYTINALNNLIKSLNGGILDTSFKIDWQDYRNCILLTNGGDFKRLNTQIHKIINL